MRSIAHLRPRTNTFGAIARIRSALSFATHEFFQTQGFVHVHPPIITSTGVVYCEVILIYADCEGAGEMFRVTTLPFSSAAKPEQDFFGTPTYLTVSGQVSPLINTIAC